ncbi:MAG TPA: transglutaminase domain-containing protein [Desulfatiglandales bacterium]|nr:transglutaminase domain-containing protein [Desulfatiglandales bacterium]
MRAAKVGLISCGCILFLFILMLTKGREWLGSQKVSYTIPRHIQYGFTLQNKTNRLVKEAEFWTYAPVKQTPTQQCVHLEASHPFQVISDDLGNQILQFTFKNLPPYATKIITIEADLLLSDRPNPMQVKDLSAYLRAEKYCESDNPEISRVAKELKGSKPVVTAENIFRWVAGNMEYTGYLRNSRGALYALRDKKGDCTEFMYLFAALCRANNIPARCIGGYICPENAVLKPNGLHNWVELRDNGVWNIADPQRNVFMQDPSHYIAMQVISESPQNPMGDYYRLRFAGDGLRVKMNG